MIIIGSGEKELENFQFIGFIIIYRLNFSYPIIHLLFRISNVTSRYIGLAIFHISYARYSAFITHSSASNRSLVLYWLLTTLDQKQLQHSIPKCHLLCGLSFPLQIPTNIQTMNIIKYSILYERWQSDVGPINQDYIHPNKIDNIWMVSSRQRYHLLNKHTFSKRKRKKERAKSRFQCPVGDTKKKLSRLEHVCPEWMSNYSCIAKETKTKEKCYREIKKMDLVLGACQIAITKDEETSSVVYCQFEMKSTLTTWSCTVSSQHTHIECVQIHKWWETCLLGNYNSKTMPCQVVDRQETVKKKKRSNRKIWRNNNNER